MRGRRADLVRRSTRPGKEQVGRAHTARIPRAASAYPGRVLAAKLLGSLLLLAGLSLLTVGLLGWRGTLPRNRFAGVRTPASLRSDAAFRAANRVAGPPVTAAGVVCVAGGALAYGATGAALTVIVGVTGAGTLLLVLAGGILGNRAAAGGRPRKCGGCICGAGGCQAQPVTSPSPR